MENKLAARTGNRVCIFVHICDGSACWALGLALRDMLARIADDSQTKPKAVAPVTGIYNSFEE